MTTGTQSQGNALTGLISGSAGIPLVSSRDRLGFAAFLALTVHAVFILGISFSIYSHHRIPLTLEVTLAQHADPTPPETADYLAQQHQSASGTLDKKAELTTDRRADFADTSINDVSPEQQKTRVVEDIPDNQQLITTTSQSRYHVTQPIPVKEKMKQELQDGQTEDESAVRSEIASLQAKLALQRQAYAKQPRVKTLTSVAARASNDAEYLNLWQEKIELIGNLNYPEEARKQKIYGQLRMLVTVLPDGSIHDITILKSSGHRVLDDAAVRIVRLSAPFAPFPPALRKDVDQLEIIRTWKFEPGNHLSSQ